MKGPSEKKILILALDGPLQLSFCRSQFDVNVLSVLSPEQSYLLHGSSHLQRFTSTAHKETIASEPAPGTLHTLLLNSFHVILIHVYENAALCAPLVMVELLHL